MYQSDWNLKLLNMLKPPWRGTDVQFKITGKSVNWQDFWSFSCKPICFFPAISHFVEQIMKNKTQQTTTTATTSGSTSRTIFSAEKWPSFSNMAAVEWKWNCRVAGWDLIGSTCRFSSEPNSERLFCFGSAGIKPGLKEPDRAFDMEPFRAARWRQLLFAALGFLFDWYWLMWRRYGKEQQTRKGGGHVFDSLRVIYSHCGRAETVFNPCVVE